MRFYWSEEFMQKLDVGGSPMYAMDFDDDIGLGEFGAALPVRMVLHSHGVSAGDNHIPHAIESVRGSGQSVSIRQWGNRFGTLSLNLAGVNVAQLVARRVPLGLPCKFKMGFEGMSFDDWATVGIYRFEGLTGSRNRWQMKFGDLGKLLQSAMSRTTSSSTAIFSEFETKSSIASKFSPSGSGFTISADLVTGASGLVKDTDAGARGLLYCQRTDGPGDPFYLKYTGISGFTITPVHHDVMGTERPTYFEGDPRYWCSQITRSNTSTTSTTTFPGWSRSSSWMAPTQPAQCPTGTAWDSSVTDCSTAQTGITGALIGKGTPDSRLTFSH